MKILYFDYNAASPVRPEVRTTMETFLNDLFGNPSSLHAVGRKAKSVLERVRSELLLALGDRRGNLIFTSGGTEADNLAIKGAARAGKERGTHVLISAVEHSAVLHAAQALQGEGFRVEMIPVDAQGVVDLEYLKKALASDTLLVSIMQGNNEVGTLQPIEEAARITKERGVLFHTDAVQSFGKIPLDVRHPELDLVSLSAHKLGGPKGVGALYVREGVKLESLLHGGPHERNLRAGTEAVPAVAGFGAAASATLLEQTNGTVKQIRDLRDRLWSGLQKRVGEMEFNGHPQQRLPGTLNVSFLGCKGETLVAALDLAGICVSTGSACSSGSTEPSHVLTAMGLSPQRIAGSIRFSLGWATTETDIEEALERIPPVIEQVRKSSRSAAVHD